MRWMDGRAQQPGWIAGVDGVGSKRKGEQVYVHGKAS